MPMYDFICHDCEETFEVKRSFARANDPATCPSCISENTQKVLSAVAVIGSSSSPEPERTPVSMNNSGGCCGGGSCGCNI